MDSEAPLGVVDFTSAADYRVSKTKQQKKRKRVGNRIPVGEKLAKAGADQDAPNSKTPTASRAERLAKALLEGAS